jgi:hypothetical protein
MLFKGTTEIEVNGTKIGLKFGTLASGYFCEQEKITLAEMMDRLNKPTPLTLVNCMYSAAKAYCDSKAHTCKYTPSDAGDWIDEIGLDKATKIIYGLMEVYEEKLTEDEKKVPTPEIKPG